MLLTGRKLNGPGAPLPEFVPAVEASPGSSACTRHTQITSIFAILFQRAETGFTIAALFIFSGALIPLLLEQGGATNNLREGNLVLRGIFAVIQGISLLLLLRQGRIGVRTVLAHWPTMVLVTVALLSVIWSDAPDITLRRGLALFGTTAFGVYLASRYSMRALLRLLGWALGTGAVLSLATATIFPAYGTSSGMHQGLWRGIFTHKNTLAQMMVLSTVVFFLLWSNASRRRWAVGGCFVLSLVLLVLSGSSSGLVIGGMLMALVPLYRAFRRRNNHLILALLCAVLIGGAGISLLLLNADVVLAMLGKDITLTGRTVLWEAAWEAIWQRPWLGYGYSAFWLGWQGGSAAVWTAAGWETPHSHNGFLDLWLELGLLGVTILLIGIVSAGRRAVAAIRYTPGAEALWPVLLLSLILVYSFTESVILRQNNIFWVLYVATVCSVGMLDVRRELPERSHGVPAHGPLSPGIRRRYRRITATRARQAFDRT